MRPVGGQPTLSEDQDQRAEPKSLCQPGIVEPHAEPRLAERQAEAEEDQQGWQADPVREPGCGNRREHHNRAQKQDDAEIT